MNNRKWNSKNEHQGSAKKVLCVCSAGLLRSPTTAYVLNRAYSYNTRAVGTDRDHALIPIDDVLVGWADEIVCMTQEQKELIELRYAPIVPIICLGIEDSFAYGDLILENLIMENYSKEVAIQEAKKVAELDQV